MESKTTKTYRHCLGEEYEISIFICRGRQKAHYPKCPTCEFRTTTEELAPISTEEETKKPSLPGQSKTGSIMVKSVPPSADIFIDGDNIGVTPAIITQIYPGRYKIRIKMDGYDAWNQSVDVKINKETSLTAVLQGKDGALVIGSEPANANITIDGNSAGETPKTINNVKAGKYLVEVNLDGYEIWSKEISVEPGKEMSLTAELITKYGSISLDSEPTKATIFLDSIEIGTTPANLRSVPHGPHLVEIRMDGYNVWEKSVNVEPGEEEEFTAILQVKTGTISIKSVPENAEVFLDGKHVGSTPGWIGSIIPGTHEISVKMDEYDVWSETVNVEAGKENEITAALQRSTGTLMVESDPVNATIFFDGKKVGTTPDIIMSSAKGTHTVEVRMEGYDIWKNDVDFVPGTEKSLTAILQIRTGSLNIKSKPQGGTIFLNGKEISTTPDKIIDLKPGTYHVEVRTDGHEDWSENIEVYSDKENYITAVLQKITGAIIIKSDPTGAAIIIDGNEIGNTPVNITNLEPDKYLVEIKMEGYENWSENTEIEHGKEAALTAVLKQLTGSLTINSEPSNAKIIIDGKEVATTPANITDLEPGKHLLQIKREGYADWSENIDIEHSKEAALTAVLQQLTGTLKVESDPSNALIIIEGKKAGDTPTTITDLKPGTFTVEVKKDGYKEWQESVNIVKAKEATLKAVLQLKAGSTNIKSENLEIEIGKEADLTDVLQIKAGSITINSVPSDAMISIDGKEVDTTPLTITDPGQGIHSVEIKMEGYETWSDSVNIVQGEATTLTATLQIKAGTVNITSEPPDAATFIDGEEVGRTPVIITNSSPGTHTVELKMNEFETWSDSVDIEPGKEVTITAKLQPKAGSININSNPPEAMIHIDGKKIGETPKTITDLSPGTYLVEVIMDGYKPWSESTDVKGDKGNTLTAKLQALTGSINIQSNPPEAIIYLDGEKIGTTPDTLRSVTIGTREVEIRKEGYAEWKKTLSITQEQEITLNATLQHNTGTASIESDPTEATIFLDGKDAGKTPASLTGIEIGMYEVELRKDGYVPWKKTIKVEPDRVNTLTAILLKITGSISINSNPSNAIIRIDGKETGNTPAIITDLSTGKHLVEVKLDGYEIWCDNVNIDSENEIEVTAELQMMPGSVHVQSNPSEAMILIDSKEVGTTPKVISDLSIDKHLVEIRMEGCEVWSKSIEIEPGIELSVTAELQMETGSVSINSEPSGAMILIDGKKAGSTPETRTGIKVGRHQVEVRMEGHETWSESVEVSSEKENVITTALKGITGAIIIKSNLPEARIFLDEDEVGTTPYTISPVAIGTHEIEVRMEGYAEWKKKIKMKKGKEIPLNAVLRSITGTINLESEPTEAMILLDGENVGNTPKIMTGINAGKHEVEVRLDGYDSWLNIINIKAGREYTLTAELQRRSGSLVIISNPPDAMIYIQNRKIGRTPRTLTELKPGKYAVEIRLDEYHIWNENVDIVSANETTLHAELQTKPGSISIKSKPSDAKILIDDNEAGTTPETISDIQCGIHSVKLMLEGYEVWSENVKVKSDKEFRVTAQLQEMTGSINIKSEPPHAMILIDGKKAGATPAIIKGLSPGTHSIDISMDGYSVWSERVEVAAEKEEDLTARLREIKGTVNINSRPSGALILLDGKEAGTTPETITDMTAGMHLVEVSMEGYEDWSENIKVITGKEYTMTAALQEITGSIQIQSEPSNATILVNGNKSGSTPETITNVKPGIHQVEVKMDGFESWNNNVEVTAGEESELTVTLQQMPCSVNIESNPTDATILVDNRETGNTPKTINDLNAGEHKIVIRKSGYEDWSDSIIVRPDKESTVTALLQKCTGSMNIKSEPPHAMIFIDGKKAGTTPVTVSNLSPDTHMVSIMMDGHVEWKESVDILSDEEIDLTATLQISVGSVTIKSNPSEALILLDGRNVGTTPATLSSISVGTHEIEIKTAGYESWKRSIIVKKDSEKSLSATLLLNVGSISIESYPEKAIINLDGKEAGKTPKQLTDIIVGAHEVEVLLDGYVTWQKTIKTKAGKDISLSIDLIKESESAEPVEDDIIKASETSIPLDVGTDKVEHKTDGDSKDALTAAPATTPESQAIALSASGSHQQNELVKLRSTYDKISDPQIESLSFISISEKNNNIFLCHSTINHRYEPKPVGNGDVIIDHTTGLMWYQAGSSEYFSLRKANKWLKKSNKDSYAGFNDWRLPSLEEALSLLEFETQDGGFIDPVFDSKQWGTWTGDKSDSGQAWIVTYVNGTISQVPVGTPATFVRPVRSLDI